MERRTSVLVEHFEQMTELIEQQEMGVSMDGPAASRAPARLETWDYVTMCGVVLLSSCVGVYHVFAARQSKNAREFLISSRELGVLPLILSSVASFVSAVGVLGFPAESYSNGAVFVLLCLCPLIIILPSIFLYLPVFFNIGTTTIYEYLEFRFNRFMRTSSSIILTVQTLMYTACVIYAPALALHQVTGLHLWFSVISIGIICVLYTSMGGLKAVVWADVAQVVVMICIFFTIFLKGIFDVGGVSDLWRIVTEGKRGDLFIFSPSPNSGSYTTCTMLIGGSFHLMSTLIINQIFMQRFLSNRTLAKSRITIIGTFFGISCMTFMISFCGLIIYARYHNRDPLLDGTVMSRDQLMALFGMETLSFFKGLRGVFVGAILCATLSTLSSTLNALTAVTIEDYIRPCCPDISDATVMKLSKILGVVYGIICVGLVAVAESMGGVAKAVFSIVGMTSGPVFGLFTVGMLLPWVSTLGGACGFYASLMFTSWACIGNMITRPVIPTAPISCQGCDHQSAQIEIFANGSVSQFLNGSHTAALLGDADFVPSNVYDTGFPLYSMSPFWYPISSVGISILVSMVVSLIFGTQNPSDLDPKLISPITRKICSLFPVRVQRKLGYGPTKKATAQLETRYLELPLKIALTEDDFTKSFRQADS